MPYTIHKTEVGFMPILQICMFKIVCYSLTLRKHEEQFETSFNNSLT